MPVSPSPVGTGANSPANLAAHNVGYIMNGPYTGNPATGDYWCNWMK